MHYGLPNMEAAIYHSISNGSQLASSSDSVREKYWPLRAQYILDSNRGQQRGRVWLVNGALLDKVEWRSNEKQDY